MKQLSIYTTEGTLEFNYEKVYENLWSELTELQTEKVGFTPVFDDVYTTTLVQGYSVFKLQQSVRKAVKPDALEREFNARIKKLQDQSVQVDMEELLEEVNTDLTRMSDITTKSYLVVYDHVGKRFLIDADRNKAEVCLSLMHTIFEEECQFEVLMPEEFQVQPLLTDYVLNPDNVPEPLIVGETAKIGAKALAGKSPKPANIVISKEDVTSDEFTKHLTVRRAVHSLELDYDGIIYFNIDHTFKISGVKYDGSLKYKQDINLDDQDNQVAEYQQILPEVSKLVNLLVSELDK